MSILNFLHTKAKAFVVFLFSLISLGLFIISTTFATAVCKEWYGIIVGIVLMIIAIVFHCRGKKRKMGYLLSFLLNSVANGFSVSAYYLSSEVTLNFYQMFLALILPAAILLLVYLMLQTFHKTKKVTVTVATILNILLLIAFIVFWAKYDSLIFSFGFFGLLISIFYLCVFGITINHDERSVLRDVSFGSFGSFIILTVVVVFILSEGEILEGFDLGIGGEGKTKKEKKK